MRVGICSVGTEIVAGDQVDTNAAWLAQQVRDLGATPVLHLAAPDDLETLVRSLQWLLEQCDGVIVGGGLGPTPDDLTRGAVAQVANVELVHRPDLEEAIRQRFAEFGARMTPNNLAQAMAPKDAVAWPPVGTAPGFVLEVDRRPLWVLPGVPWEMKALFEEHVAPDLLERAGGRATVTRVVHVTGMGESSVADALTEVEREAAGEGVQIAYLATRHEVQVKLSASGPDLEAATAATDPWVGAVRDRLGKAVAGIDAKSVEQTVIDLLTESGRTVAVAESATAGLVCARIADAAGASKVLEGGIVVYMTHSKVDVAGLDPGLLEAHPPVSQEVTRALALAIRDRFGSDYGVATTGVAGPAEQDGVEVGQVYWAVAGPDGDVEVHGRRFTGDRSTVRGRLATAAIDALRRRLVVDTAP